MNCYMVVSFYWQMCVSVCVCVRERVREGRGRLSERG